VKLICDEPHSKFAFNYNLRCYTTGGEKEKKKAKKSKAKVVEF